MPKLRLTDAADKYRPTAIKGKHLNSLSEYMCSLIAPVADPLNLSVALFLNWAGIASLDISHISCLGKSLG
jgi:hypothetical protein